MNIVDAIYEAAANAGFLRTCRWQPTDGGALEIHEVGFKAPDDNLLQGLSVSTEYEMSYPATIFKGLRAREVVEIEGVSFQVREVRAVGDGAELCASLTRL